MSLYYDNPVAGFLLAEGLIMKPKLLRGAEHFHVPEGAMVEGFLNFWLIIFGNLVLCGSDLVYNLHKYSKFGVLSIRN